MTISLQGFLWIRRIKKEELMISLFTQEGEEGCKQDNTWII